MNNKLIFYLLIFIILSCKESKLNLNRIEGKRIEINPNIEINDSIEAFIAPYRNHIKKDLDSIIAYAADTYSKNNGELNTAIGNLMADIVISEANPIFKRRTKNDIDAVLLNHGGIRAIIPKGPINARTAYEVMPFENKIVVLGLKGTTVKKLIEYLVKSKRAHPIAGLKLTIGKNNNVISSTINNKNIDPAKIYYFATSDYLYNGGDNMTFFKENESFHDLGYKIRNAMIDYFKKTDTINPVIDNRFIRKD